MYAAAANHLMQDLMSDMLIRTVGYAGRDLYESMLNYGLVRQHYHHYYYPRGRTTLATTTAMVTATPLTPMSAIPSPPPDLDYPDISERDFAVVGSDPHRFDREGDRIGCE